MDSYIEKMKAPLKPLNDKAATVAAEIQRIRNYYVPEVQDGFARPVMEDFNLAVSNARATIERAYADATASVEAWARMDGTKLNADDLALLNARLPLTVQDLRRMILRNESNYTMICAVVQYADAHGLRFALGYIPAPEDRLAVYKAFYTSAMSLVASIESAPVSDLMITAFADPDKVTDPRYIYVMKGLSAVYAEDQNDPTPAATFDFNFRPVRKA